jgi:hypothetical protein
MTARLILVASSVVLGLAGLGAVFAPQELLAALGPQDAPALVVLVQLLGALYVALAVAHWTARNSRVGGIYNRPLTLGTFAHWLVGALVLLRFQLTTGSLSPLIVALALYAVFAALFGWLVFGATGLDRDQGRT